MISARPPISERRGKSLAHSDEAQPTGVHHMVNEGPPDGEVVARVLGGDGEAFGILIRRYEPGLLRFATRMLGNPDAAADAGAERLGPRRPPAVVGALAGPPVRGGCAGGAAAGAGVERGPPLTRSVGTAVTIRQILEATR